MANDTYEVCGKCGGKGRLKIRNPGKFARGKGQKGERNVMHELQIIVNKVSAELNTKPLEIKRNTLQSRGGGHDFHGLRGFAIEVKLCETENIGAWWRQTLRQAELGEVPILVYRRNYQEWKVKMRIWIMSGACIDPWVREPSMTEIDIDITWEEFQRWFEDSFRDHLTASLG